MDFVSAQVEQSMSCLKFDARQSHIITETSSILVELHTSRSSISSRITSNQPGAQDPGNTARSNDSVADVFYNVFRGRRDMV